MSTFDNYPNVLASETLWREAQNQPYSAMLGVLCVMRNLINPTHDLVRVIARRGEFSSMTVPGDPNLVKWPETNDVAFPICCQAVDAVFGPTPIPDVTNGATFYFSPPLTEPPSGWGAVIVTGKMGELTFCKAA